jgi:colanic acid/amylovoran biosynthesis protein
MGNSKRNIAILHAHNTFNNGSFMMLINFIGYLKDFVPEGDSITLWIEMDGRENELRLNQVIKKLDFSENLIDIKYLPFKITSSDNSFFLTKIFRLYSKLFNHRIFFQKEGISGIVILGGDDISEYYKKWAVISDLIRIYLYSRKITTVLAGQTIGPFTGIRKKLAVFFLGKVRIFTRDPVSYKYLTETLMFDRKQITNSVDLTFPDLQLKCNPGLLSKYNLIENQYITIVPGGFFTLYTKDKKAYLLCWKSLLEGLHSNRIFQSKKIVILPHVTRPEDDRDIITELEKQLFGIKSDIVSIYDEMMPHELRWILGHGYCTISSRMHAAISTLQMFKPAISIGYSVKYQGVIGESVGLPELIVHTDPHLFDLPEPFSEKVMICLNHMSDNYFAIIEKLNRRIPVLKRDAIEQVRNISGILFS